MELSSIRPDASLLAPTPQIDPNVDPEVDPEAGSDLERLFATFVVKELRKSLPNGFFGQGAGADIYEGWLEQHLGASLADSGAMDLAGSIKASIQSKQRAEQAAAQGRDANPQ